jgi:hypothetical protein
MYAEHQFLRQIPYSHSAPPYTAHWINRKNLTVVLLCSRVIERASSRFVEHNYIGILKKMLHKERQRQCTAAADIYSVESEAGKLTERGDTLCSQFQVGSASQKQTS